MTTKKKWFHVLRPSGEWDTILPSKSAANQHAKQIGGTVVPAEEYERQIKNGNRQTANAS